LLAAHPDLVIERNPHNAISMSVNIGIERATNPVVVRVDGHSVLPPRYAKVMVTALHREGAVNAGGRMLAAGETAFESAVAWGYNNAAGLGGAIYHTGGEAGPAESAYLGVFLREAVRRVGGFDESLSRGEDWELNLRLRDAGGLVWFEPGVEVVYRPRSGARALAKQFFASGRWRGELLRRLPGRMSPRYLVPPAFVVALAATAVGVITIPWWPGSWALALAAMTLATPVLYGAWACLQAGLASGVDAKTRVRLPFVLATMHAAWGAGALLGLVRPSRGNNELSGR
jgi:hypothetical protein